MNIFSKLIDEVTKFVDLFVLCYISNMTLKCVLLQCALCSMVIKDNLRMMRHLIGHAYNEGSYTFSDSSPQCRFCLKDFLTDFSLQSHIEEVSRLFISQPHIAVACLDLTDLSTQCV